MLGFPVNKESTASSVLCVKCRRELDKFEKFFEGLSVFKEKADQTLKGAERNDRTGNSRRQNVKVPQKFADFEQSRDLCSDKKKMCYRQNVKSRTT